MDESRVPAAFVDTIQPIVLVGGRSRRFGTDKLLHVCEDERALVAHPIDALRGVFGRRVRLVGVCDPRVLDLGDGSIPDEHPGIGPIGGVASALADHGGPIFVLAGDMPGCKSGTIWRLLTAAHEHPDAAVVVAATDRVQPCAGIYRPTALEPLRARIRESRYSLTDVVCEMAHVLIQCPGPELRNVNEPSDLQAG